MVDARADEGALKAPREERELDDNERDLSDQEQGAAAGCKLIGELQIASTDI